MNEKRDENNGRQMFSEWIVGRTDERFPAVIANRMWKRVMGKGLYDPVDEYMPPGKTHHPPLAKLLGELMAEFQYDLRAFQHVLLLTRTFQFGTNPNPSTVDGGDDFHGRKIQRLSAEQIWDSLITLAKGDPDKDLAPKLDDTIYLDGRPVLVGRKTMPELSKEVLALKSESELRAYFSKLADEIISGSHSAEDGGMMMTRARRHTAGALVRASELPSPAPRDHFVQDQLINNPDAHLYQCLESVSSDQERIRRLHISILNRPPTDQEMSWMLEELAARGVDDGCRNIVSSLIMSSEFLFLQ